jgi:hypothetical protein
MDPGASIYAREALCSIANFDFSTVRPIARQNDDIVFVLHSMTNISFDLKVDEMDSRPTRSSGAL